MNVKQRIALAFTALSLVAAAPASAGALEANSSGLFLKGETAQIYITGLSSDGLNFRLAAGNITPGLGCVNGPTDRLKREGGATPDQIKQSEAFSTDCLKLEGWATRTDDDANEFLYANRNGACVFYLRNQPTGIKLHDLSGDCGADDTNRSALKAIEGVYQPAP